MNKLLAFVWETIKIVAIALIIILPVRMYLFQPFYVAGASMEDNFHDGEYLVVDELSFRCREPRRGEVIVFKFPYNPAQFYIKRIIGLPGETIEIKQGQVLIYNQAKPQGFILDESAYLDNAYTAGSLRLELSNQDYFVMGDNRVSSSDSRRWGSLGQDYIVGRAWLRAWPFGRAQILSSVSY